MVAYIMYASLRLSLNTRLTLSHKVLFRDLWPGFFTHKSILLQYHYYFTIQSLVLILKEK